MLVVLLPATVLKAVVSLVLLVFVQAPIRMGLLPILILILILTVPQCPGLGHAMVMDRSRWRLWMHCWDAGIRVVPNMRCKLMVKVRKRHNEKDVFLPGRELPRRRTAAPYSFYASWASQGAAHGGVAPRRYMPGETTCVALGANMAWKDRSRVDFLAAAMCHLTQYEAIAAFWPGLAVDERQRRQLFLPAARGQPSSSSPQQMVCSSARRPEAKPR